jgi:hypothetical protein
MESGQIKNCDLRAFCRLESGLGVPIPSRDHHIPGVSPRVCSHQAHSWDPYQAAYFLVAFRCGCRNRDASHAIFQEFAGRVRRLSHFRGLVKETIALLDKFVSGHGDPQRDSGRCDLQGAANATRQEKATNEHAWYTNSCLSLHTPMHCPQGLALGHPSLKPLVARTIDLEAPRGCGCL